MRINAEEMLNAVKKLKGFVEKSVILDFTMTPVKGATDKRYLKISASNGISQADIMAKYVGDNEEEKTYFVGDKFVEIIESISNFGETIELSEDGDLLKVVCGSAAVPVGKMTDAMSMKMVSLKEAEFLQIGIGKSALSDLIGHSAFCAKENSHQPIFSGTVIFTPENDGDKRILRAISCEGASIAGSVAEVSVKADDVFQKYVSEKKRIIAKVTSLAQLVRRLETEQIDIFFTEKQVILRDGFDLYLISTISGTVADKICGVVTTKVEKRLSYSLDRESLKKALSVIALSKAQKVLVTFAGEEISFCDAQHGNRVAVQATATISSEKEEATYPVEQLKAIFDNMPATIELFMPAGGVGLYASGKDCIAFLLPIRSV